MVNRLNITFEGQDINENGVPVEDLHVTFSHMQKAVRLMVGYLSGHKYQRGRPPDNLRLESMLRLCSTSPGSLSTQLTLGPPRDRQTRLDGYASKALDQILSWQEPQAGNGNSLPPEVAEELKAIGPKLSPDIKLVKIGEPTTDRHIKIWSIDKIKKPPSKSEKVLMYGWLKAINWSNHTAQLYRYDNQYVNLQFDASFNDDMKHLAMLHVRVQGRGRINNDDRWMTIKLEEISRTKSNQEPFDLEAFKNTPNPKIFDPKNMVTASEPFDVDKFINMIYESRRAEINDKSIP